jgi:hypothetical protein
LNWPAIVVDAVICCIIGAAIGSNRGQGGAGAWLGLLLGPIGVLLCLTMKATPAVAAARLEAIEAERARIRAEREGMPQTAGDQPASS